MPGTPALEKIAAALATALTTPLDPALVQVDRNADEEWGNAELQHGAVNIVHKGTRFTDLYQTFTTHTALFDLDMLVQPGAAATNAAKLREMEARLVETLWANRTLGGLAQDVRWTDSSDCRDVYADAAGRTLGIEILFNTPVGDHRTILGAAGAVP